MRPETTLTAPNSTERARRRQDDPVRHGPADRGQATAEGLPARRAERRRGLLLLGADLAQHGHDLADDERQRDERGREHHPRQREDDVERQAAEPAVSAEEEQEREPDDDRRKGEREVDHRIDQTLAREALPDDQECA